MNLSVMLNLSRGRFIAPSGLLRLSGQDMDIDHGFRRNRLAGDHAVGVDDPKITLPARLLVHSRRKRSLLDGFDGIGQGVIAGDLDAGQTGLLEKESTRLN